MLCVATEISFPSGGLTDFLLNIDALRLDVLEFEVEAALHLVARPTRLLVDVIVVSESHPMLFYSIFTRRRE